MTEDLSVLTVYVGDDTPSFHLFINRIDNSVISFNEWGKKISNTVYVHAENFLSKRLCDIFFNCKEIIYVQPSTWSSSEAEYHTIGWLEYISRHRKIKMFKAGAYGKGAVEYESVKFSKPIFLNPVDQRKSDDKQVWVVGCSFANGHGLTDTKQRFGQIFADKLGLPVSFLSMTGASNQWAADQIFKADIRPGDIVVWGITGTARSTVYTEERVWPITIHLLDKAQTSKSLFANNKKISQMRRMLTEEFLLSDHSLYDSINHIEQVNNYLDKLNVEYLLGYFADLDSAYPNHMGRMMHYILDKNDPRLFVIRPEYPWADIIIRSYTDINNEETTDDQSLIQGAHHPGPSQHAIYANDLIDLYNKLYK